MRDTRPIDPVTIRQSVQAYFELKSFRKAARTTGVGKTSVWRWVKALGAAIQNKGKWRSRYVRRRCRKHPTVLQRCMPHVIKFVSQDPLLVVREIKQRLLDDHQIKVSNTTVRRCFRIAKYSHKSVWPRTEKPDLHQKVCDFRVGFRETAGVDDLICVDETAFDTRAMPTKGWAPVGERLHVNKTVTNVVRARCTVVAAMTTKGLVSVATLPSGVKNDTFAAFIETLKGTPQKFVLMDNLQVHKSAHVLQALRAIDKTPIFIPPYSPQYNPIEQYFAYLKHHHRRENVSLKFDSVDDFLQHVDAFVYSCSLATRSFSAYFDEFQRLVESDSC